MKICKHRPDTSSPRESRAVRRAHDEAQELLIHGWMRAGARPISRIRDSLVPSRACDGVRCAEIEQSVRFHTVDGLAHQRLAGRSECVQVDEVVPLVAEDLLGGEVRHGCLAGADVQGQIGEEDGV